ncbi:hypothetical protein EW146_g8521 [Bondarzewia mesenterica]|uniref:Uncharacterized protein n=1 Tax=Bondarzewia mesenterica TaxID=1095465 RepID=A0A4S4LDZ9_9AGAM|nr:hypothetical protein EW146_g8521 [Bondarzewia mesenterica]
MSLLRDTGVEVNVDSKSLQSSSSQIFGPSTAQTVVQPEEDPLAGGELGELVVVRNIKVITRFLVEDCATSHYGRFSITYSTFLDALNEIKKELWCGVKYCYIGNTDRGVLFIKKHFPLHECWIELFENAFKSSHGFWPSWIGKVQFDLAETIVLQDSSSLVHAIPDGLLTLHRVSDGRSDDRIHLFLLEICDSGLSLADCRRKCSQIWKQTPSILATLIIEVREEPEFEYPPINPSARNAPVTRESFERRTPLGPVVLDGQTWVNKMSMHCMLYENGDFDLQRPTSEVTFDDDSIVSSQAALMKAINRVDQKIAQDILLRVKDIPHTKHMSAADEEVQ